MCACVCVCSHQLGFHQFALLEHTIQCRMPTRVWVLRRPGVCVHSTLPACPPGYYCPLGSSNATGMPTASKPPRRVHCACVHCATEIQNVLPTHSTVNLDNLASLAALVCPALRWHTCQYLFGRMYELHDLTAWIIELHRCVCVFVF